MESTAKQDDAGGLKKGIQIDDILDAYSHWNEYQLAADLAYSVYDGDVLSPETKEESTLLGKPQRQVNLVKSIIMTVLGHSEKLRTDVLIRADDDESKDSAEVLNEMMNEAWRMCGATNESLDAHEDQLVAGLGWLDVRRNRSDILKYKYSVNKVDWREMKWDITTMRQGFDKCRWVARERFMHEDEAIAAFPKHKKIIQNCISGDLADWDGNGVHGSYLVDEIGKRVAVREVYERVPVREKFVRLEDGTIEEYENQQGLEVFESITTKIKKSWFIANVKIWYADYESPHPPFVPMWGYVLDRTKIPCGIVRDMIDPIYIYNKATNEQLHILDTCKIKVKPSSLEGGVDKWSNERIRMEAQRRDSVFTMEEDADMGDVVIEREWENLSNLQGLKEGSQQELRDVSGIYQSFSGQGEARQSGKAIANLAELGSTNMARLLGNKARAEKRVAEILMGFIIHDMGDEERTVEVTSKMGGKRQVTVNRLGEDAKVSNSLMKARTHVAMAPIQSSAGYRAQVQDRLENLMGQMVDHPIVLNLFVELYIEYADFPHSKELLEKFRMQSGLAATPEEMAEQMAAQSEEQQKQSALEQGTIEADIDLKAAQAEQARANARKALADAENADDETPDGIDPQEIVKAQQTEEQNKMKALQQWEEELSQVA